MAHGALSPVTIEDVEQIVRADKLSIPKWVTAVLYVLVGLGLVVFLKELLDGDAKHAWVSLQVNYLYWLSVAAASSCFAAVFHICNAQWSRPIRRVFEAAVPFFSWSPVVLLVLYFGHDYMFVWAHYEIPGIGKNTWLSPVFLYARDFFLLLLLVWAARKVVALSLRRDLIALRGGLTGVCSEGLKRWEDKPFDKFVREIDSDPRKEIEKASLLMSRFSPAVVIFYAMVMSLIAFDQIMSVDPVWYSTLFGAHYFMSGVYLAVSFAGIGVAVCWASSPLFFEKIERRTLHDLGKLVFGFGIFWAYMFWSHYLPIWYGNLPEETGWVILRLREEPWRDVAWAVLGLSFIIPFLLGLSRDVKQIPQLLAATGAIVAVGLWLQSYLLFAPTLFPYHLPFSFVDFAVGLGFLALYAISSLRYLSNVPLMPFGDFYQE